jgi:hypothetical protein
MENKNARISQGDVILANNMVETIGAKQLNVTYA